MTMPCWHFDTLYRANADPLNHQPRGYERRRYDATFATPTRLTTAAQAWLAVPSASQFQVIAHHLGPAYDPCTRMFTEVH